MTITAREIDLLNRMNSTSVAVQLGTLISNAESVTAGEIAVTNGAFIVGNGSGVGASVTLSGDLTSTNAGVTSIGAAKVTVAKLDPAVMLEASVTLTQANIQAMSATPVSLIAAPGAGKLIIVDEIEVLHTYAVAAYTNGGDVSIQYTTSAKAVQVFDVAVVTGAATANYLWKPTAGYTSSASTSSETDLSTSINKAVEITNATAAFATGNSGNIFKFRIRYHVVTVLT